MSGAVRNYQSQARTFQTASRPDLSRLPAYVEPPRLPQAKRARTPWAALSALAGVTLTTISFFGWYLYADHPRQEIALQAVPLVAAPRVAVLTAPQDVPLPDGLQLQSTARVQRPVHTARLTRPSNG